MANKGNYLPLKLYKKLLVESYLQNCEDGDRIKEYLIKNHDPILQLEDRYIPPRPKGYILTEKYIRKMAEKPEKNHMRRIPMKNSMSSGCIVISENRKKQGIKMHPQKRTNQDSTKSYEFYKHMRTYKSKDSLKNFYLDDFNSVKENKFNKTKTNRRYLFTPKDNVIIPPEPMSNEEEKQNFLSKACPKGFKRPVREKTHNKIFNYGKFDPKNEEEKVSKNIKRKTDIYRDSIGKIFEGQGKITKAQKVSEKPCNNNYQILSKEAQNNVGERYYYESNKNQW